MTAYLLDVRERFGTRRVVPLSPIPYWIGREAQNDLVLQDQIVSRRHACIVNEAGKIFIVDNRSSNGVFLNRQPVKERRQVGIGDVVSIGPYELRFTEAARLAGTESGSDQHVDFYPYENPSDPLRTLTAGVQELRESRRVEQSVPWSDLVRLLIEGDTSEFFQAVLRAIEHLIEFDRCFLIMIRDGSLEKLEITAQHFAHPHVKSLGSDVYVSRGVLRRVTESREAVILSADQPSFKPTQSFVSSGASSVICLPLVTRERISGALYIDRLMSNVPFNESDVTRLAAVTSLMTLKLDNIRSLEEHVSLELRQRELEAAQSVQQRFLPRRSLSLGGYSFHAVSQPCQEVGGDCLDFIDRDGKSIVFAVGDVAGKGLAASLYMVGVLSTLRAVLLGGSSLRDAMCQLECYVRTTFKPGDFLTLFLGEIDPQSHKLTYCNAGHLPPLIISPNRPPQELGSQDPALNVVQWDRFKTWEYSVEPGELLIIYTDGLSESENVAGDFFGTQRMVSSVVDHLYDNLEPIGQSILNDAQQFGQGGRQKDDMAMILIRRKADLTIATESPFPDAHVALRRHMPSRIEERDEVIRAVLETAISHGFQIDPHFHRLCLDEAIINSVVHGNKYDDEKSVEVIVYCSPTAWSVDVVDEGEGFDWRTCLERIEKGLDDSRLSGRGLELILKSCARVVFLDGGRRLRMVWTDKQKAGISQLDQEP